MKPVDVKQSHILLLVKNLVIKILKIKIKIGGFVRISKYKNIFTKGEEIAGNFYKNDLQKTNQKVLRVGKVIKRKSDKLYVEWNGYDSPFTSGLIKKAYYKCVNIFQNQNL